VSRHFLGALAAAIAVGLLVGGGPVAAFAASASAPKSQPREASAQPEETADTPELKAFRQKADAALKALDGQAEKRDREARRAVRGICTGCFDNLRQTNLQSESGSVYDPYSDTAAASIEQDLDGSQPMSILPDGQQ
jgi:hypothetical protein